DDVAGRWWTEHGQHLAGASNAWGLLAIVLEYFGKDKLLPEITDDDVASFVAWRRGHRIAFHGGPPSPHKSIMPPQCCGDYSPARNCGASNSNTNRNGRGTCCRCRPSVCASFPTTRPTGSMPSCATTMHRSSNSCT